MRNCAAAPELQVVFPCFMVAVAAALLITPSGAPESSPAVVGGVGSGHERPGTLGRLLDAVLADPSPPHLDPRCDAAAAGDPYCAPRTVVAHELGGGAGAPTTLSPSQCASESSIAAFLLAALGDATARRRAWTIRAWTSRRPIASLGIAASRAG